jgi:hypothetical protein
MGSLYQPLSPTLRLTATNNAMVATKCRKTAAKRPDVVAGRLGYCTGRQVKAGA